MHLESLCTLHTFHMPTSTPKAHGAQHMQLCFDARNPTTFQPYRWKMRKCGRTASTARWPSPSASASTRPTRRRSLPRSWRRHRAPLVATSRRRCQRYVRHCPKCSGCITFQVSCVLGHLWWPPKGPVSFACVLELSFCSGFVRIAGAEAAHKRGWASPEVGSVSVLCNLNDVLSLATCQSPAVAPDSATASFVV